MSAGGAGRPDGARAAEVSSPPELEIDRSAPVERTELGDGTSWCELTRGLVRRPDEVIEELLRDVQWGQGEVWRYDRFVEERRLGAWIDPAAAPVALRQCGLHLESRHRVRFDGASAIWYRDGGDFQGLHADREMRWLDDTLIAIVVLGEARPFVLRPRRSGAGGSPDRTPAGHGAHDVVLHPGHGDLLVMGGRCQRDWVHGVPAVGSAAARVSVTWRWSYRRGRPDTGPGYFDGRHHSDRPGPAGYRVRRGR